jgi:hypothetical protein
MIEDVDVERSADSMWDVSPTFHQSRMFVEEWFRCPMASAQLRSQEHAARLFLASVGVAQAALW